MSVDLTKRSTWLAALDSERSKMTSSVWPSTPGEGILTTCQLSDELRQIALTGLRLEYPTATELELDERINAFRLIWERSAPRLHRWSPSSHAEQ